MSRDGFLIMDSDLHLLEPDDLWARYLDEPYRADPPRFFGAQRQSLAPNIEDKGNADTIFGMEVQGRAIPAYVRSQTAVRQSRGLKERIRARIPHFQLARSSQKHHAHRNADPFFSQQPKRRRPNWK